MFPSIWTAQAAPITNATDERATLERAQAGDETATMDLFRAYLPALSAVVRDFRPMFAEEDELRSVVFVGFLEAVHAWNPEGVYDRLAGIVRQHATDAASREAGQAVMSRIPERTLKRFLGILRRADGDPTKGAELAPTFDMASTTFTNIYVQFKAANAPAFVNEDGGSEAAADTDAHAVAPWDTGSDAYADAEDKLLAEKAFAAVDDLEAQVCALAYGFADYDPQPDAEIAHRLGLSSRLKALRTRNAALAKMRDALGA